jgi:hypothetical protein
MSRLGLSQMVLPDYFGLGVVSENAFPMARKTTYGITTKPFWKGMSVKIEALEMRQTYRPPESLGGAGSGAFKRQR